jgi:hypothetical protein
MLFAQKKPGLGLKIINKTTRLFFGLLEKRLCRRLWVSITHVQFIKLLKTLMGF